jgi:transcriptional regulator with GAF, ATPase, and Fis domain
MLAHNCRKSPHHVEKTNKTRQAARMAQDKPRQAVDEPQTTGEVAWPGVADWRTVSCLARGGGGTVWLARHVDEIEPRFILKVAAPGLEHALAVEHRALLDTPSPRLPMPVAWLPAADSEAAVLVLDRRPGVSLDVALRGAEPTRVAHLAREIWAALADLHAAGVVHGDLHPGNILVDGDRVALLDLGLATAPGLPLAGVGHLRMAAPDVLRGGLADPRDDLFSAAMAVWLGCGLPEPYPNYPAVLPRRADTPRSPPTSCAPPAVVEALVRCLQAAREHRPRGAAELVAQFAEPADASALAAALEQVARRPWRWRGAQARPLPQLVAGAPLWLEGEPGSGRTGVLAGLADASRLSGRAVVVLQPGEDPVRQACERARWPVPPWPAPAEGPAVLTSRVAAESERWRRRLEVLHDQAGHDAVWLVDDADDLPQPLLWALSSWTASACALATRRAPAGAAVWRVPPPDETELCGLLQVVAGGRPWHAGAIAELLTLRRDRRGLVLLAAHALRSGALNLTPTAVELNPGVVLRAAMAAWLEQRRQFQLVGDELAWPPLARLAEAGPEGVWLPAVADGPWLRRRPDGRAVCADEAARAWLRRTLPPHILAQAVAERRAGLDDHLPAAVVLDLRLALARAGSLPAARRIAGAVQQALGAGAIAAARELVELARETLGTPACAAEADDLALMELQVSVAAGDFAAAEARWSNLSESARGTSVARLAEAEWAFRSGQYPRCRAAAQAVLASAPSAVAWTWLAFAATWQGDRDAARQAVAAGEALAQNPGERALLAYLRGVDAYYAGRLDEAEARLSSLEATSDGSLRAAAAGGRGLVAHRRGVLALARQHYDRARRWAEAAGDLPRACNMAMNEAVAEHERGELRGALEGYDRAVRIAERAGDGGAEARVRNNRGNLLAILGDDRAAEEDLRAALVLLERNGNVYLSGNVCCVLAELARRRGQLVEAASWLEKAEAAMDAAQAVHERAEVRLERGRLHLAHGQLVEAETAAHAVLGAARQLDHAELQARGQSLLAEVALTTPARAAVAVAALTAALAVAPPDKSLLLAQLHGLLAKARFWLGDLPAARQAAREAEAQRAVVALTVPERLRPMFEARHAVDRAVGVLLAEAPAVATTAATGQGPLATVLAINRRLSAELDLDRLLELVMDAAVLLTGAERGFLLLDEGEPSTPALRVAVARNLDRENLKQPQHKLSHTVAHRVFAGGEALLSTDAQQDPRFAEHASIHAGNLRSILCVPLDCDGRRVGVLYVDNRFAAGAFSVEHAGTLAALADQAAIAIRTARLLERERRATSELGRRQADIEQLNAQLQTQLSATQAALGEVEADLRAERTTLARRSDFRHIVGEHPSLHRLFAAMERVRDHDVSVLLRGESGTGKELVARALHFTGRRKRGPFVALNCAALPPNLLESELFGHVRGAFTGAVGDRRGLFESADGGTLLLDEVGEMPLDMQAKLLRVLQTGEVTRVGDRHVRKVDARVVAATHRDIAAMVAGGKFREDLMYRLRVVELEVPPLRQRPDDIALLVEHFLAANRAAGLGQVERLTPAALRRLRGYPWPGNVRQLETVLKSACLFANGPLLDLGDLDAVLPDAPSGPARAVHDGGTLDEIITRAIQARVATLGGNKRKAAESLGIDRSTIYARLKDDA